MISPSEPECCPLPTILAVDDNPANLSLIAALLEPLHATVRLAESGAQALACAELAPQPDLILLDIMMPGMDGHQVMARLRDNPLTRHIPVIYVTAMDSTESEEVGLQEGAVDYVTKPIKPSIFRARVSQHLELKFARDQLARHNLALGSEVERQTSENAHLVARLQMALSAANIGIWEYRHDSGEMHCSQELCDILGLAQAPNSIDGLLALIDPADQQRISEALRASVASGATQRIEEFRARHASGRWLWLEARGRRIPHADSTQTRLTIGTICDISQRKNAEQEQQLASAVYTGINDGVVITNPAGVILSCNAAFSQISGYAPEELIGQPTRLLRSEAHSRTYYQTLWNSLQAHDRWEGEITNRRKDGTLITEWASIAAVRDHEQKLTHYVATYRDLTERKEADSRIQYLASYDLLTDLPNRALFADRLSQAMNSARRLERQTALILLDLDRFRSINETLGPPAGDAMLREAARRLGPQIRDGDTLGRRSGNEFGFILTNLSQERDAITLAQRLLDTIAAPYLLDGQSIALTASIGVAIAPRDGDTPDELIRAGEIALARAKQAGRNTFRFYAPEMNADAARRLGLESALRDAQARQELSLVYQPQVSLESGNIIGMEALLRWHNTEFGQVSPAEFIPIAEECGLIVPIGEWVLATACQQARQWRDLGFGELRLAVNLSTRQFRLHHLPQIVNEILNRSGLPPGALELEITESAFIDNVDAAVDICKQLKTLGVKLSLDDFGTGYSSLSYLSRFPFDKIKIDQSFVRDIIENPINAAIATSTIVMGHSLNLAVLAEGVETEAQANFLRGRRCDAIQGYLFSRPVPAEDFGRLIAGNSQLVLRDLPIDQGQTLLIVDDEKNILNALSRLLRREGYTILTASSPSEAFEHLARQPVQVILSDQRMPDMSGTEFFARVRQLYPRTIRIVLTGYTDLDSVTAAINRGAIYKFLTKPWDDDLLRDQLREAFRLAKAQPSSDAPLFQATSTPEMQSP